MVKSIATALIAMVMATVLFNTDLTNNVSSQVPQEVVVAFNEWKLSQKKLYASPEEGSHRLKVFYANYQKVESVNSQDLSYKFKLNDFADLSHEEFIAKFQMEAREVEILEGAKIAKEEDFPQQEVNQTPASDFNYCEPAK
jgi:hypothetical protein